MNASSRRRSASAVIAMCTLAAVLTPSAGWASASARTPAGTRFDPRGPVLAAAPADSDLPLPTESATSDPPSTDPLSTDPPSTDPPTTDPPSTDPPSTDPPSTDPPSTDPPTTAPPPSTDPPTTVPPPTTGPPVTTPAGPTSPGGSHHPPVTKPPRHGPGSGGTGPHRTPPGKPHPKKKPARPHPHKTLRPAPVYPGAHRPHPHRKPWPITLTIKTVPALSGVRFTVDGHPLVTGSAGTVGYTVEHDFTGHRLSVVSSAVDTSTQRYRFSRWAGQRDPNQAFSRTVSGLPMRANYAVTAAFTVQQQVIPKLIRQDGTELDPRTVSLVTARSETGAIVQLPPDRPTWLDSQQPSFHHSRLTSEPVTYSLQSVMIRGANVVDAGRQTFTPEASSRPTFTAQFHDLTITGHDALSKSALGASATLTYPDGGKLTVRLDSHHTVTLPNLPRGNYQVTLAAGRSIVGSQQFVLSKNKTADLTVITARDLSLLLGLLLILAAALVIVGRQYWRRWLARLRPADRIAPPAREKILT